MAVVTRRAVEAARARRTHPTDTTHTPECHVGTAVGLGWAIRAAVTDRAEVSSGTQDAQLGHVVACRLRIRLQHHQDESQQPQHGHSVRSTGMSAMDRHRVRAA